jgi:Uma2 family endonuclease
VPATESEMLTFSDIIWTYADYLEVPEDGKRYQVMGGVLYMTPDPTSYHQKIVRNLMLLLWNYIKERGLGQVLCSPIDVIFSNTDVVQPDIVFLSKGKLELIHKEGICGPPDLVIEVVSPASKKLDESFKKNLYERHGVYEYVLVYPEAKRVVQYASEGGSYKLFATYPMQDTLQFKAVPLAVNLSEVFEE